MTNDPVDPEVRAMFWGTIVAVAILGGVIAGLMGAFGASILAVVCVIVVLSIVIACWVNSL